MGREEHFFVSLRACNQTAMNTIWIVLPILTLLMFDLGLTLKLEDFGKCSFIPALSS